MKLIYCINCGDVFNLTKELKMCSCGKSYGKYVDNINAEISSDSIALGFTNNSFADAITNRKLVGNSGEDFIAFVITEICTTIKVNNIKFKGE